MKCTKCGYSFNNKTNICPHCAMSKHADLAQDSTVAAAGTAAGAAAGTVASYLKPVNKHPYVRHALKEKFMKKLKPGDILMTGGYETGPWEKGLQSFLSRNKQEYHTAVYIGKDKKTGQRMYGELLVRDQVPDKMNAQKDLDFALTEDSHVALRPKWKDVHERNKFVYKVKRELPKTSYDSVAAVKTYVKRKAGIHNFVCNGKFCSNAISSHMPQRFFGKVHRTAAMPYDFYNNKFFKPIAELRTRKIHLPASNKALGKYVLPAALVGGALTTILSHAG